MKLQCIVSARPGDDNVVLVVHVFLGKVSLELAGPLERLTVTQLTDVWLDALVLFNMAPPTGGIGEATAAVLAFILLLTCDER